MKKERLFFAGVLVVALVVSGPQLSFAQTTVTDGNARVVTDGDYVRIETADGVTEVSGDWRSGGTVRVGNTDALLHDLGAVEAADHIEVDLAGDVLFEFGKAAITDAAAETLSKIAQVIRDRAVGEVLIVGHTDAVGDEATNQKLSEGRAVSVIRWLNSHEGIPASIMVGRGMGEAEPVAYNTMPDGSDNPEGRARNRRVEFYVGTTKNADVRVAAGLVTVSSPEGDVRITDDAVDIGGQVQVDAAGVHMAGVDIATDGSVITTGAVRNEPSAEGEVVCAAGKICRSDCPNGDCRMTCSAGATCTYGCAGGDCRMFCAAGANCNFSCAGGDCNFSCALGSNCQTSCLGGDCTRR